MKWTRKKAIVTGGAGFIGSAVVDRLLELGADVTVVDKLQLTSGSLSWNRKLDRLQHIFSKHGARRSSLEICDLETDRHRFQHIARSADVMFHLSAVFGGREFVDTRQADCSKMLAIDHNAIEAAHDAGVGRFHYSSSACFPAGTKIWTRRGKRNIEEISVGDLVFDHLGREGGVTDKISRRHTGVLRRIWISGFAVPIESTPDHPFLVGEKSGVSWKRADDLEKGSRILLPQLVQKGSQQVIDLRPMASSDETAYVELVESHTSGWRAATAILERYGVKDPDVKAVRWTKYGQKPVRFRALQEAHLEFELDDDLAWFLGVYAAEGWVEGETPSQIIFAFGDEAEFQARVQRVGSKLGLTVHRRVIEGQEGIKIEANHPLLANWLVDNMGTGTRRKRVPEVILNADVARVISFIRGYLEGDGCLYPRTDTRRPRITWGTVSRTLAEGLQTLFARIGLSPSYVIRPPSPTIQGRTVAAAESIQSYFDGRQSVELLGKLRIDSHRPPKVDEYQRIRRVRNDDGTWTSRLVSRVLDIPFDGLVYNLEVSPNHSYCVGDGVAVHNCVYPNSLQKDPTYLLKEDDILSTGDGWKSSDNLYGFAKLMGELQCKVFHDEKGLKTSTCRYLTVYGPGEFDTSHAISALIEKALDKMDPYVVWGSGHQERGFTYVTDIVEGSILACENITDGTPVNLGSDKRYKIREVAEMILAITGHKGKMVFDKSKPEGPFSRALDIQRARSLLQWEPKVDLKEGLEKTIAWHQGQRESVAATARGRQNR